eukprot:TRINITY_DN186_c0_g1_i1.p3 TRINITY_DN186_c0_g1~~TRINITY_DN186_c0_g1_i1.p3  ORF type:complete len:100 (+),score=15.01 TRINITY_DN186_c0_g1_i1:395-694(+)
MPDLEDFIDKVVGGEAGAAREQLQSMIGAKTADALDARKQEISSALFNNGEEQELGEPEVEYEDDDDIEEIEASADDPEMEYEYDDSEIEYEEGPEEEE